MIYLDIKNQTKDNYQQYTLKKMFFFKKKLKTFIIFTIY